jgi:hypothetical protein
MKWGNCQQYSWDDCEESESLTKWRIYGWRAIVIDRWLYRAASSENKPLLSCFGFVAVIGELLKADDRSKLHALRLADALLKFKIPGIDVANLISSDVSLSLLRGSSSNPLRLATIQFLSHLPIDSGAFTTDAQLLAIMTHLAENLQFVDNDFTAAVMAFISPRQTLPSFTDCISSRFVADNSFPGAVVIAVAVKLFQTHPQFAPDAFPSSVSPKRLLVVLNAIPYIAARHRFTPELTEALSVQFLSLCTSSSVLKIAAQKAAVFAAIPPFISASADTLDVVSRTLFKAIVGITDVDILRAFATALAGATIPDQERPLEDAFCRMFCHLFVLLFTLQLKCLTFRHFFVKPSAPEPSSVELLPVSVPDLFRKRLQTSAEAESKTNVRLLILVAAMPSLEPKKSKRIDEGVFSRRKRVLLRNWSSHF